MVRTHVELVRLSIAARKQRSLYAWLRAVERGYEGTVAESALVTDRTSAETFHRYWLPEGDGLFWRRYPNTKGTVIVIGEGAVLKRLTSYHARTGSLESLRVLQLPIMPRWSVFELSGWARLSDFVRYCYRTWAAHYPQFSAEDAAPYWNYRAETLAKWEAMVTP